MKFYNSRRVVYVPFNFDTVDSKKLSRLVDIMGLDLSKYQNANDAGKVRKALKSGYYKTSKDLHPDLHPGEEAKYNKLMQELNILYKLVKDVDHSPKGFEYDPNFRNTSSEDTAKKARDEDAGKADAADKEKKAREDAARKADEAKKAREEADRKAKEDARKAQEDADRKAQEDARKAQEDADRRAQEEFLRKLREQAEKAKEDAARKADAAKKAKGTDSFYQYQQAIEKLKRSAGIGF